MTMPPDRKPSSAEEVVRGLTVGQRACFTRGTAIGFYARSRPQRDRMVALGLVVPAEGLSDTLAMDWTPLGQQVRALLTPTTGSTTR
jgi:hypothetical protein